MQTITDDFMLRMLPKARNYCIVILRAGPKSKEAGVEKIIWKHGRRNFALHADGVLSIVCPVIDGSDVRGVGIFNAGEEETKRIMDEDPGKKQRYLPMNFMHADVSRRLLARVNNCLNNIYRA